MRVKAAVEINNSLNWVWCVEHVRLRNSNRIFYSFSAFRCCCCCFVSSLLEIPNIYFMCLRTSLKSMSPQVIGSGKALVIPPLAYKLCHFDWRKYESIQSGLFCFHFFCSNKKISKISRKIYWNWSIDYKMFGEFYMNFILKIFVRI